MSGKVLLGPKFCCWELPTKFTASGAYEVEGSGIGKANDVLFLDWRGASFVDCRRIPFPLADPYLDMMTVH